LKTPFYLFYLGGLTAAIGLQGFKPPRLAVFV